MAIILCLWLSYVNGYTLLALADVMHDTEHLCPPVCLCCVWFIIAGWIVPQQVHDTRLYRCLYSPLYRVTSMMLFITSVRTMWGVKGIRVIVFPCPVFKKNLFPCSVFKKKISLLSTLGIDETWRQPHKKVKMLHSCWRLRNGYNSMDIDSPQWMGLHSPFHICVSLPLMMVQINLLNLILLRIYNILIMKYLVNVCRNGSCC